MIDLTVKTLDSRNHGFSVPDDITVKQLKERIADSVNVPADSQRLIYCGRVLQDDKNLSEYDVNGKVIHLVQRPPPMPHSGGSEGSGASRNSSQPYSRGTGANHRRHIFQGPGARIDGGNAMYLGAMAFPADLMESQGLTMPQPRQCLSQSRLAVAKQMLRRASNTLNRLEHPNASNDSPTDNSPDTNSNISSDEALPGSIAVAAQVATAAAIAAAVSAAQGTSVHVPHIEQPSQLRMDGTTVAEDEMRTDDLATGGVTAAETGTTATNANQDQPQQPPQPASGTDDQSQNDNRNGGRSRYPRTTAMAELLDTLADVNRRLQPFLEQFHQTMREDPVLESPEETQRMFAQVSEVMHFLSHAYHALSDIMCDFSQPPPRYLRCRPVLIQHSAVVQTGIPIQAQINLTANALNQNQASNQGQQQAGSQASRETSEVTSDTSANNSSVGTGTTDSSNAVSGEQTGGAGVVAGAAGGTNVTATSDDHANRTQPTQGSRSVNIGGPNFELFMDVAPGSITIDSLEATVVTNANSSNPNEVNVMGGFPWGTPPPAEFIQNLMQALAGQMIDGGANRQTATTASSTTNTSTTQQTPTAQQAQNPPTATANSQARGNTATHPTTSTQTRSTSRPHVHLTPAVQGLGASNFDPFLPCNSHHIRATRRRNSQQQQAQQQQQQQQGSQQQQSQQSPPSAQQQATQNTSQSQSSQNVGGTGQQAMPNNAPSTPRRIQVVPPMPAQDRNVPNMPTIDAAFNSFVTVVMNMANRNLGRWNVGPRTNSTATNTTGSGPTRNEGDNVTVTTQTPPIQVLPNAFLATNAGGSIQELPLPPGFPVAMMNHVISALSGGTQITSTSSSALSEVLLQALPDFSYTPGESIFMDLFMNLAQSLTFVDMVNLGFGHSEGLIRARSRLREFLSERLLENRPFSQAAATQATGIINQELRSFLENVISQCENRLREDIDLIATINQFNLHHLPMIMTTILEESDENFHRVLFRQCHEYINYFFAIMQYCCLDGAQGMENIIRGFVRQMTTGVPEQLRAWTVSSSVVNFRHYLLSRSSQTNLSHIYQFIVYRAQPPSTQPPTQIPATEHIAPPAEPMDTEPPNNVECIEEAVLPATAEITNTESLPDVLLGSEDWHNSLPSDWVPIITRDTQRQRRQNPQPPFSDAYLSGMPSKRRKLITSAKPQGNLSQVISENMQAAVGAAGVTAPGVEVGVVAQGAGADPTLRLAYRDQIRASVRQNLQSHPDYTPDKYPNAAKYFDTK
ncbi:large proline-rich protein bag6-A isoform X2 [Lycorma delicatula]|uniref:large proline-rich protein bag6-A isoform X2 n=1 Tax=Lycorma delicatula TaxID=130591 RepID=UPI003F51718A